MGKRFWDLINPTSQGLDFESHIEYPYNDAAWPRRRSVSVLPELPPYDFAKRLYAAQHMYIGTIFSFLQPQDFEKRLEWVYSQGPDFSVREACLSYCQILMIFAYGQMYSVNQWAGSDGPPGFTYFMQALQLLPEIHEEGSILFVEVLSLVGYYMQNLNRRDAAFLYVSVTSTNDLLY
jgi:proline utilization trans-activator